MLLGACVFSAWRRRILIDASGWRDPAESISCLPVLLDALWRGVQIRFAYRRVLGEAGERTVDPLGLVAKESVWYLVAMVEGEFRTYRVSRIASPEALQAPSRRPEEFDLASYWNHSAAEFREKLPRYYATFLAGQPAMRWIHYRGWRVEEQAPEGGRIRIRVRFDAEEEAVQLALSLADGVEAIDPAELRAKVRAAARAVVKLYEPA